MCGKCIAWGGKLWHQYGDRYYERTDKSVKPKRTRHLHRAVWEAEHGPIPAGHHIHHRDGNKLNNEISNLECLSHGEHQRHHLRLKPIPKTDWAGKPDIEQTCVDCGGVTTRKRIVPAPVCQPCQYKRADLKREVDKLCSHCGQPFRSRMGTLCSQRCVNLATNGATVRVLPEGRRRA